MTDENTAEPTTDPPHIRLPKVLREGHDAAAIDVLQEYFTRTVVKTGHLRSGARWDGWDPSGQRAADADVFTADDLVAITTLSVEVPPEGAWILLVERRAELAALLAAVGPDRDLAGEAEPKTEVSPEWRLENGLRAIHGIGRTTAAKLIARKRPRLYPVYDDVVARQLDTRKAHLEPVRLALRHDEGAMHRRLLDYECAPACPRRCRRCGSSMCWLGCRARGTCRSPAPSRRVHAGCGDVRARGR